jgi:hypothetical protein
MACPLVAKIHAGMIAMAVPSRWCTAMSFPSGIAQRETEAHAVRGSERFMQQPEVEVYARTLARAAGLSGGSEALAKKLNVSTDQLDAWIAGTEEAPATAFLLAVDLLMEDTLAALRERSVG